MRSADVDHVEHGALIFVALVIALARAAQSDAEPRPSDPQNHRAARHPVRRGNKKAATGVENGDGFQVLASRTKWPTGGRRPPRICDCFELS